MPGTKLAALFAALLSFAAQASAAPQPEEQAAVVVVEGLAKDDLLNVRATASATGMVIGRLPNGSALRNYGCDEVNGYKWCKIAAVDDERLHGWTPARYLQGAGSSPVAAVPQPGEPEGSGSGMAGAPSEAETDAPVLPAESPIPTPSPAAFAADPGAAAPAPAAMQVADLGPSAGSRGEEPQENAVLAADLSARLGESPGAAAGGGAAPASVIESDTVASAFRTAFAAPAADRAGPDATAITGSLARQAPAQPKPVELAPVQAAALPVPAVAKPEPAAVLPAAVQASPTPLAADAAGEIPCARYIGQAMTRCAASVARAGADQADVTVTLPDGGRRTIRFRAGMPEGSNSRGAFRFTREGDLNMIRVGTSERFEIPDALAFGD